MFIVDLQQVMIASIMMQLGFSGGTVELPMLKHMVLNSLRSYRQKYGADYGEMIIATDTGSSWRRGRFAYYKANRKKDRDNSTLDWDSILNGLHEVRNDLREYFPYRLIEVDTAEADDVIGTLVYEFGDSSEMPHFAEHEKILILSGDKDFKQLQTFSNVEQYDPVRKKKVVENNPRDYLIEHIIRGDGSDGVPNVFSSDDSIVMKTRQSAITQKRLASLMGQARSGQFDDERVKRNYIRNTYMIDLQHTPQHLKEEIMKQYHSQSDKGRDKIFTYLMKNRMKHLMEFANEF
jgi:hypothetical protein